MTLVQDAEPSPYSTPTVNEPTHVYGDEDVGDDGLSAMANDAYRDVSPSSSSPVKRAISSQQEQGLRVEKRRRPGGFLLPSAARYSGENKHEGRSGSKGKETAYTRDTRSSETSPRHSGRHNGPMRSSPLAQVVVSPRPSYGDGPRSRLSTETDGRPESAASGSIPRASADSTLRDNAYMFDEQHSGGIDPMQIVNMALNLSESRRRNVSAGQLLQQQGGASASRRAMSSSMPPPNMIHGSYQNANAGGGSLRQYINQQRHVSHTQSPGSPRKPSGRHMSSSYPAVTSEPSTTATSGLDMSYQFSPSTLARAEKARNHIESSVEFRRLLQYLPPVQAEAMATTSDTTVNGAEARRRARLFLSQQQLGRNYNPLQLVRNRRVRARNRSLLTPGVEQWYNPNVAREWIDEVQEAAEHTNYFTEDSVRLPPFREDNTPSLILPSSPTSRQQGTATNPKASRSDWHFTPAELLADAYWLEQPGHKYMLENRHGNKIFHAKPIASEPLPRASQESYRSLQASIGTAGSLEHADHDQSLPSDTLRGQKVSFHSHNRDESRGRIKHVWQKARRKSRSLSSGLSSSDDEDSLVRRRRRPRDAKQNESDTGPLERHMDKLIDAEAQAQSQSPELNTPGTPNKWGLNVFKISALDQSPHSDSDHIAPDSSARARKKQRGHFSPVKSRSKPVQAEPRSSIDYDDSTNPNSPKLNTHDPNVDDSPSGSRNASPARLLKRPLLPFLRTEARGLGHRGSIDNTDDPQSRQTSAEVSSNPRGSFEVPESPGRLRPLAHSRTFESLSDLPIQHRFQGKDTRDARDPESAVRRFFKGGRFGEIVRNEGSRLGAHTWKRDMPQDVHDRDGFDRGHTDNDSLDESDLDDGHGKANINPPLVRSKTGSRMFHLDNLPAFRSTNAHKQANGQAHSDHISRQKREMERNKSSRFETLAPPNLDLSRITTAGSLSTAPDLSRMDTDSSLQMPARRDANGFEAINANRSRMGARLAAILDAPGQVGRGGLPITALSAASSQTLAPPEGSRDKRHWSISDPPRSRSRGPHEPTVDTESILRVEALLLCSGIKATEIGRRSVSVRETPAFLRRAAKISGAELRPVPRKEEHVLAARMLTTHLEQATHSLQQEVDTFVMDTVQDLKTDLDSMRDVVNSCIKTAQDVGDGCVGFSSEVTGQRTLQVRQAVDQIEKLIRSRRRRLRWVRRAGFGLVEWTVVLFMWWIWFIVMIFKVVFGTVRGIGRAVRWVLWL